MILLLAASFGWFINLIILIVILCLAYWLLKYVIDNLAPEPMKRVLTIVLTILFALILLGYLLSLYDGGTLFRP